MTGCTDEGASTTGFPARSARTTGCPAGGARTTDRSATVQTGGKETAKVPGCDS